MNGDKKTVEIHLNAHGKNGGVLHFVDKTHRFDPLENHIICENIQPFYCSNICQHEMLLSSGKEGNMPSMQVTCIQIPDTEQTKGTRRSNERKRARQHETQTHDSSIHI